jgi:hypothetical protein
MTVPEIEMLTVMGYRLIEHREKSALYVRCSLADGSVTKRKLNTVYTQSTKPTPPIIEFCKDADGWTGEANGLSFGTITVTECGRFEPHVPLNEFSWTPSDSLDGAKEDIQMAFNEWWNQVHP